MEHFCLKKQKEPKKGMGVTLTWRELIFTSLQVLLMQSTDASYMGGRFDWVMRYAQGHTPCQCPPTLYGERWDPSNVLICGNLLDTQHL